MGVSRGPWKEPVYDPQLARSFTPGRWQDRRSTPYDWIVEGCFLRGTVSILSGDGGLGKSLLMQQLATAAAIGKDWLGMATKPCKTFCVFCEDDADELHRRQERINAHYGCEMADLEGVIYCDRAGEDSVLIRFEKWGDKCATTPLFDAVRKEVKGLGCQIVVLDTVADVFSGNEVDRNQPRRFIRELRRLAIEIQGVVILTQHPSAEGLSSGSGKSGSTGWNNSARSRLYLTTQKPKEKGAEPPPNERLLKTMKNNASAPGGRVDLIWRDGVFERVTALPLRDYTAPKDDEPPPWVTEQVPF